MIKATLVAALLVLGGCATKTSETAEQVLSELGPTAQKRLDVAKKVAASLPAPTGTIALDGKPLALLGLPAIGRDGNATAMFAEDLVDLTNVPKQPLRRGSITGTINHCAAILARGEFAATDQRRDEIKPKPSAMRGWLEMCAALRYLVVIKVTAYVPAVTREGTYVPGSANADLLVFSAESGAFLGGIQTQAQSSRTVTARAGERDEEVITDLGGDFMTAVETSLAKTLGDAFKTTSDE